MTEYGVVVISGSSPDNRKVEAEIDIELICVQIDLKPFKEFVASELAVYGSDMDWDFGNMKFRIVEKR